MVASIDFGAPKARSGHVLWRCSGRRLAGPRGPRASRPEFEKISPEALRKNFAEIIANARGDARSRPSPGAGEARGPAPPAGRHAPWISSRST